jgi:hypothetical protein
MASRKILIDGREFVPDRNTGIGRFLKGLVDSLDKSGLDATTILTLQDKNSLPPELADRENIIINIIIEEIPSTFLSSERELSNLWVLY